MAPRGLRPDLIPHLFSSLQGEKKGKCSTLKGWQRATQTQTEGESDWGELETRESFSRNHHEGGGVLPVLLPLVSRTQSRWQRGWRRRLSCGAAGVRAPGRVPGRCCGAAGGTHLSGSVRPGAADADQAVQPERGLSPQDSTRRKRERRQAGKWPVRWGMLDFY